MMRRDGSDPAAAVRAGRNAMIQLSTQVRIRSRVYQALAIAAAIDGLAVELQASATVSCAWRRRVMVRLPPRPSSTAPRHAVVLCDDGHRFEAGAFLTTRPIAVPFVTWIALFRVSCKVFCGTVPYLLQRGPAPLENFA
jgi:hypothetical protein